MQGIFGMEFFEMDLATHRLTTSPQIWVYFVTAVGATVFTVVLYYVMAGVIKFRSQSHFFGDVPEDHYVPRGLQRGFTDIEKNPKM
jgi:hypothetical protein